MAFYLVKAVMTQSIFVEASSEDEALDIAVGNSFVFECGDKDVEVINELLTETDIERAKRHADRNL